MYQQVSRCTLAFEKSTTTCRVGGRVWGALSSRKRVLKPTHATQKGSSKTGETATDLVSVWGGTEIPKPLLTMYIPIVLVLAILMYLDAAYSGDWSRIGVLTSEQEQFLRDFCIFGVSIHALLGIAAAKISKERGERTWLLRGLKTFVVGFVSFTEVVHLPEDA